MTIFGAWLREKTRRIARATAGDRRAAAQLEAQDEADPLGVDLEATRLALEASIRAEELRQARERQRAQVAAFVLERKEQSIIAALVFGCSCGDRYVPPDAPMWSGYGWECSEPLPAWLRTHAHCAGLGAMVREDA